MGRNLKAQKYQHRPQTWEALKEVIVQEIVAILHKMTRRVIENYKERFNQCIKNECCYLSTIDKFLKTNSIK
jgi:hypothetical protein